MKGQFKLIIEFDKKDNLSHSQREKKDKKGQKPQKRKKKEKNQPQKETRKPSNKTQIRELRERDDEIYVAFRELGRTKKKKGE